MSLITRFHVSLVRKIYILDIIECREKEGVSVGLKSTLRRFGTVSCREVVTQSRQTDISSARLGEGKDFDGNRVC